MDSSTFSRPPPKSKLYLRPFLANSPQGKLDDFIKLLSLSKLGPETYENIEDGVSFGIRRNWLKSAKDEWEQNYDWRKTEARINSFPNFTVSIPYSGSNFNIHFVALFSEMEDAVPLLLLHGWPGSFLEFLDVLDIYRHKYTTSNLPYHIIVPSLPGYGYSSGPPIDRTFRLQDQAQIIDSLMVRLGFSDGYVAQGGDIGSFIARILGATSKHCKAIHLNFCAMAPPNGFDISSLDAAEQAGVLRAKSFISEGSAYAALHSTRPATIGLAISSSPLALLAWIGEKYIEWSDGELPLHHILDAASLYWLTDTFPRSIFPYRNGGSPPSDLHSSQEYFLNIPMGYSHFPKDIAPAPIAWVKTTGNLIWHNHHERGGHFASLECPEAFVQDVDAFMKHLLENSFER